MATIDDLHASAPLWDSMGSTMLLAHSDYAQDWRANFIVSVTTVRAVGHVLHKVDCRRYPQISDLVAARFERWKMGEGDDELFVHFIEEARNMVLKTYSFPANESVVFKTESTGELSSDDPSIDRVVDGYFEGSSVVGLLQASHDWWRRELTEIAAHI